ncbi:MAG: cadherin-like beta sandwich domain-containing protein [Clostridia bacterium]|nr:cadherin-like beta sandwich domain-containing protein [Clostridia bacterium]
MKFKKIISALVITTILLASVFTISVSAAEISLQFSSKTIEVGNKFVVTVIFSPYDKMKGVNANIHYDNEILKLDTYEFVNCDGLINTESTAGVIPVVFSSLSDKSSFTVKFTFSSLKTGSALISVKNCVYSYQPSPNSPADQKSFGGAGQSSTLTVIDKQLPNNANLSALTLSAGTLSPNFTAARTNYTVSVPYETDKITFFATASDKLAKVNGVTPNSALKIGANTFKITVTAQNGSQKIYTVVVTRREQGATDTPPVTPTPDNPYQTVISGKDYEIVTTIPETSYLQGFTASTSEWNGKQVPVLRDKDNVFTVYYLRESGTTEIAPYTYNAELETFEALKYQSFNNKLYIFADFPKGVTMPDNYYSTYTQIGNYSVKVYMDSNSQMADFAYVYCYANGEFNLYRYDSKEDTIQRYPDIHLVDAPSVDAPAKDNFATRFASLSTNGKILLIAMLVAALCVVTLVIFLIIMAFQKFFKKQPAVNNSQDFSFDDVTIVGENDISSSSK